MKNTFKFTALFLAALMLITVFATVVLAETEVPGGESSPVTETTEDSGESSGESSEESSEDTSGDTSSDTSGDTSDDTSGDTSGDTSTEPDPNAFTVNVVIEGGGSDSANIYFDGVSVSGQYISSNSPINMQVEPKAGYKIISAEFGVEDFMLPLTEAEGNFSGTSPSLAAGKTYILKVVTELVPIPVKLTVETIGVMAYTVSVGGETVDLSSYSFMSGDNVTVDFEIAEEFLAEDATLTLNGVNQTLEAPSFSFTITSDTKLVMLYGVVPVKFVLVGPGQFVLSDIGEADELKNNSNGTHEHTLYLKKGNHYSFTVKAALGYEVASVELTEPERDEENGTYYFFAYSASTVTATMRATSEPLPDNFTVQINTGTGGTVTVGDKTIIGGLGTKVVLEKGESLEFTVTPDEGYEIDVFRVGGESVKLDGNTYILKNIAASTTVSIKFKSINSTVDPSEGIGVDDIDWSAGQIIVDVTGGKLVLREVFDKIETLTAENGKYVEFRSEGGSLYVPYGGKSEGSAEIADLSVKELSSGSLYTQISSAVLAADADVAYKAFSFNIGLELPEGTQVSFKLDPAAFAGKRIMMCLLDGNDNTFYTKDNSDKATVVNSDGTTGKYYYDNETALICAERVPGEYVVNSSVLNDGGSISPEGENRVVRGNMISFLIEAREGFKIKQILVDGKPLENVSGIAKYTYVFDSVDSDHEIKAEFIADNEGGSDTTDDTDNSNLTTVVVILIIVLVAVAGAAALFIVKWRQEKF